MRGEGEMRGKKRREKGRRKRGDRRGETQKSEGRAKQLEEE